MLSIAPTNTYVFSRDSHCSQITREGEIVDDVTFRVNAARKEQAQNTKNLLAASIVKKAAEVEVRVCAYTHARARVCVV